LKKKETSNCFYHRDSSKGGKQRRLWDNSIRKGITKSNNAKEIQKICGRE
jgi:hypothetical protein